MASVAIISFFHSLVGTGVFLVRCSVPYLLCWLGLMLGFLVYFYAPYWRVRRIPGPPFTPIVGHLPLLAKFGPDVLRALAKEYGPMFRFHMGRQPLVIVADPELCREVGIKRFKDIRNRTSPSPTSGSPLHEKGLFLTRDSRWSSMRNAIIPFYQPTHLSTLIPTMQSIIDSATRNLDDHQSGGEINISHLSLRMAIDIIGKTAFGVEFGLSNEESHDNSTTASARDDDDDDVSSFLKQHMYSTESLKMDLNGSLSMIVGLLVPFLQNPCRQILRRIPGTVDRKMHVTNSVLGERIDGIIEKREGEASRGREARDFLSAILTARRTEAAREIFTRDYVSALTYEHLLAGSATTSFTLSAAVYLICKHPKVECKLLDEIDSFGPRAPTAEDLHTKFPYLDQIVRETMRFYTASPLVARETSADMVLGGYEIPKGTWVWLALGVLAKDPKNFPDPDVFRPERFDPNGTEERRRHPYANIPFGIGPRTCIGQKFALQEIKLSLVHLYRHYIFELSPAMKSSTPQLEYGLVVNFKDGIRVRVVKRG